MFSHLWSVYQQVIQTGCDSFTLQILDNTVHEFLEFLECGSGGANSERHARGFILPLARGKSGLVLRIVSQFNLIIR